MCEPTLILSAVVGGFQAMSNIQEQNRQHAAAVAKVNRENEMARQEYISKIQISATKDQRKAQIFKAELEGAAAEKSAYYKQREINQSEADRASAAAQMELNEKIQTAQLQGMDSLVESIQAQGTILAGNTAGQSMLLESQQVERELGIEQSKIDATLLGAQQQYGMKEFDIAMGKYSADAQAWGNLSGGPTLTPGASAMTVRPMKQRAPRKPSSMGAILGGITTGVGVYGNTDYGGRKFGSWPGSGSKQTGFQNRAGST